MVTPELIEIFNALSGSPLHVILLVAVVLLYRDNRQLRQDYLEYLKEAAKHGDVAAQNVIDRRNNGRS